MFFLTNIYIMAQRRMSRKSFRKSRGRKTRSMRRHTMGGASGDEAVEPSADVDIQETVDEEPSADVDIQETVDEILSKINTRLQSTSPDSTEDENLRNEIKKLSETGKASCRGKYGLRSFMDNQGFRDCENLKTRYYFAIVFALFTQRTLYTSHEELADMIKKFDEKAYNHFQKAFKKDRDIYHGDLLYEGFKYANEKLKSSYLDGYYRILRYFFTNRQSLERGVRVDNVILKLIINETLLKNTLEQLKAEYRKTYPYSTKKYAELLHEFKINTPLYHAIFPPKRGGKRKTRKGKSRKTRRR